VLNRDPVNVDFSFDTAKAGTRTMLVATGTDPEGYQLTFTWFIKGKEIAGRSINYTFQRNTTYHVTLMVEDEHGGRVSLTKDVVVSKKDKEDAAGINPFLVLASSLIAVLIIVILLYVQKKKEPVRPKTPVDDTAFKNVNAKWPQTMQTVRKLDPKTARIFARAKVLKFDPVTSTLKLGLSEEAKKAVTPEALEVMERGFQKVHGTRVFLFIESGPKEMTDEQDDELTLTPMAEGRHRGPKVKKDGPDDDLTLTPERSAFQPRTRDDKRRPPGGTPKASGRDKDSRAQRPGPRTEKKSDRGPEDGETRRPPARSPRSREGRPPGPKGGRTAKKVVKRPKTGSPKKEN
jgi:PKD repeat protein